LGFYEEQILDLGLRERSGRLKKIAFMMREVLAVNRQALRQLARGRVATPFDEQSQFQRLRSLLTETQAPYFKSL
jgi:hypothetical protein